MSQNEGQCTTQIEPSSAHDMPDGTKLAQIAQIGYMHGTTKTHTTNNYSMNYL